MLQQNLILVYFNTSQIFIRSQLKPFFAETCLIKFGCLDFFLKDFLKNFKGVIR